MTIKKRTTRVKPRKTNWRKGSKDPHPTTDRMKRSTVRTPPAREALLDHLKLGGSIEMAYTKAGMSSSAYYKWIKTDLDFAAEVADAIAQGTGRLEDAGIMRAIEGVDKALVSGGEIIGYEKNYSDTNLQFFLRARRPEKYRDNSTIDVNQNVSFVGAAERLAEKLTEIFRKEETADKGSS